MSARLQKGCVFVGRMRVFNAVVFNASRLEGRGISDFVIKIKIGKPGRKLRISYVYSTRRLAQSTNV